MPRSLLALLLRRDKSDILQKLWDRLPPEIWVYIFSFLDIWSIRRLAPFNKYLSHLELSSKYEVVHLSSSTGRNTYRRNYHPHFRDPTISERIEVIFLDLENPRSPYDVLPTGSRTWSKRLRQAVTYYGWYRFKERNSYSRRCSPFRNVYSEIAKTMSTKLTQVTSLSIRALEAHVAYGDIWPPLSILHLVWGTLWPQITGLTLRCSLTNFSIFGQLPRLPQLNRLIVILHTDVFAEERGTSNLTEFIKEYSNQLQYLYLDTREVPFIGSIFEPGVLGHLSRLETFSLVTEFGLTFQDDGQVLCGFLRKHSNTLNEVYIDCKSESYSRWYSARYSLRFDAWMEHLANLAIERNVFANIVTLTIPVPASPNIDDMDSATFSSFLTFLRCLMHSLRELTLLGGCMNESEVNQILDVFTAPEAMLIEITFVVNNFTCHLLDQVVSSFHEATIVFYHSELESGDENPPPSRCKMTHLQLGQIDRYTVGIQSKESLACMDLCRQRYPDLIVVDLFKPEKRIYKFW